MENQLKRLRKAVGLTQAELADKIGTTRSQLVKLERGERRMSDVWLKKLAPALGVSQGEILGDQAIDGRIYMPPTGVLYGNGETGPVPEALAGQRIARPFDMTSAKGISAWLVGDTTMAQECAEGSFLLVVNPREQYCEIREGALLLIQHQRKHFLRKFITTGESDHWLVPCPPAPDPRLASFVFDPDTVSGRSDKTPGAITLNQVIGVVLWESRRRIG